MKKVFLAYKPISIDFGLLILRIVASAAMITHGWPKFNRVLEGNFKFGDPLGIGSATSLILAASSEFICSILILVGLFSRWATIPLIITMSVAAFIVHGDDGFGAKEKAVLYLAIFVTLFFTGSGRFSLDRRL